MGEVAADRVLDLRRLTVILAGVGSAVLLSFGLIQMAAAHTKGAFNFGVFSLMFGGAALLSVPALTNPSSPKPKAQLSLGGFGPFVVILLYRLGNQPQGRLSFALVASVLGATFVLVAWALTFALQNNDSDRSGHAEET